MKKNTIHIILGTMLIVAIAGCTSTKQCPTNCSQSEQALIKNKSNSDDVIAMFGKPHHTKITENGDIHWVYSEKLENGNSQELVVTLVDNTVTDFTVTTKYN